LGSTDASQLITSPPIIKIMQNQNTINPEDLGEIAKQIRATVLKMALNAKVSHLKGTMSCIDILVSLFNDTMNFNVNDFKSDDRDRFIFSNGHNCGALYAVMAQIGIYPRHWLKDYCVSNSSLPMHPCMHMLEQLEFSSGSLGHGLGVATGICYALKLKKNSAKTFVLMSDGECNEGSVWESAMYAAAKNLDNLVAIVDNNKLQAVGRTYETMGNTSLSEKFEAFGWIANTINGNNIEEIVNALKIIDFTKGQPNVIIAETTAGAGVSFMEDELFWHYRVPSEEDLKNALAELNVKPIF
jgi:transketolase